MTDTFLKLIQLSNQLWKPAIEILIIALIIYFIIHFLQGTRGASVLKGLTFFIVILLMLIFVVAWSLDLHSIIWILHNMLPVGFLAVFIIFQPEIRRGLIKLGQNPLFAGFYSSQGEILDELVKSVVFLSNKKIGALIAIERETPLKSYIEAGVKLEAQISREMLTTIFYPGTTLHDGAVVIKDRRIAAAGCLFPLTDDPELSKELGTRHRAGIGISEEGDTITVIVSEETGTISVGVRGKLTQGLNKFNLKKMLEDLCSRELDIQEHLKAE